MGLGLIWYAALDLQHNLAADCISQKHLSWFWDFSVFDILLIVFRFVIIVFWHLFDVSSIAWGQQKDAQRKTMQYGCGISSRSALGTRWVTKTMPRIAYCPELIAIGSLGHPGKLFSLISIDFHGFSWVFIGFSRIWGYLGPEGWPACGPLWHRVADLSYPFKMMQ